MVLKNVIPTVLFADTNGRGETDNRDETKQQEDNTSTEEPGQQVGIDFDRHPRGMRFNRIESTVPHPKIENRP